MGQFMSVDDTISDVTSIPYAEQVHFVNLLLNPTCKTHYPVHTLETFMLILTATIFFFVRDFTNLYQTIMILNIIIKYINEHTYIHTHINTHVTLYSS